MRLSHSITYIFEVKCKCKPKIPAANGGGTSRISAERVGDKNESNFKSGCGNG